MRIITIALLLRVITLDAQTNQPIFMLNTEMHTAPIKCISTDQQGRYLLTASIDKTARLWDLSNGRLLRVFRPPVGEGYEGQLFAGALSPDGSTVAAGGWTGFEWDNQHSAYIFDAYTGQLQRRLTGLPNIINDLEFSPDGRFLAVALGSNNGIRVYRTDNWELQAQDSDYGGACYNIAFDTTGRLASVCLDGFLRLYDARFNLSLKKAATGGQRPFSLAFSPDNRLLAVGYDDTPTIQVLDADHLTVLYAPDVTEANSRENRLEMVVFSKDGTQLAAGFGYSVLYEGASFYALRVWNQAGKGNYVDIPSAQNSIMDIKSLPNGFFVLGSNQPGWTLVDPSGEGSAYASDPEMYFFNNADRSHLLISTLGEEIGVTPVGGVFTGFNVINRQITSLPPDAPPPATERGALNVSDWFNSFSPKINDKTIDLLQKNERCRSVAIAHKNMGIIFGTNQNLYCTDDTGEKQWEQAVPATAWAVNIDTENKIIVAALGDGTLRWYRFRDGRPLLALYLHPDGKRWVLWTPAGYYDCSPDAENLLGWHQNQGANHEAVFFPVPGYRDIAWRPDIINGVLQYLDEGMAIEEANKVLNQARPKK